MKYQLKTLRKLLIYYIFKAYKKNKQIFIIGNGGSASTASHFACDLSKGTLQRFYDEKEKRFRVISLTDNVAHLTSLANDLDYNGIFVQQLKNLAAYTILVAIYSFSSFLKLKFNK